MSAPSNIRVAFYGDDFTGSTDVMEALTTDGLKTVLFLRPPTAEQLARYPETQAFGIAGGSRTMSPEEMDRELPSAFEALKASGAPLLHYKVCSTFDSSPQIGSIGKAIEIGRRIFGDGPTPLVVGAPVLGRYVVFGNLFARSGLDSEPSRLDRHSTMRCHPVTPMDESDLRIHLSRQTSLPIQLVDVLRLNPATAAARSMAQSATRAKPSPILLFDTLDESHLQAIGAIIEDLSSLSSPLFCVGSSGLEYALAAHHQSCKGDETSRRDVKPRAAPVRQLIAVSGSCSPVTHRQMERAAGNGFSLVPLAPTLFMNPDRGSVERVIAEARVALVDGQSVILHTSLGPEDPRIASLATALVCRAEALGRRRAGRESPAPTAALIGSVLGQLMDGIATKTPDCRLVVCGGDTSTHVARALGVDALEFVAPMAPGSPLCRIHAPSCAVHGREIVFKGGQVGRDDFFQDVLAGGPPSH
jgi:uncharacterized protein YgbK (DUF1537 family)